MKKYLVRCGSGNAKGKAYYFDTLEEALVKAKELQKRQKDHHKSWIIKGTLENGEYRYYVKDTIDY